MDERLKQLRKELGLTQQEFSDKIGIKRNTFAQYENGRNEPIDAVVRLICSTYNVNEEWLRTGAGEMFVSKNTNMRVQAWIEKVLAGRPEDIRFRAVSLLADMPEEWWDILADRLAQEAQRIYKQEQIADKVRSYEAELKAEAASEKSEASQTIREENA